MQYSAPQLADTDARKVLGSFLFRGDDIDNRVRVSSGANMLLLDQPTTNLDPFSRYVGTVTALNPERLLKHPDGDENHRNEVTRN